LALEWSDCKLQSVVVLSLEKEPVVPIQ
jgi:hypothetical protein